MSGRWSVVFVCALAVGVATRAISDPVNVIYQHNPNLVLNVNYTIAGPPFNSVTIIAGVAGETFEFEATLEENGQYQEPGDIDAIVALDNAGPVALTVVGHNGHPYGARDLGTIQLHNTGVSGSIRSLMLSRNLATLDAVTAAELSGQCEIGDLGDPSAGRIVHDISVDCFTGAVVCRSLGDFHGGAGCWTNPTQPSITVAGDFDGALRLEGPFHVERILVLGATTGTIEVYGTLDHLKLNGPLAAPGHIHAYGPLTYRVDLLGGVEVGAGAVFDHDIRVIAQIQPGDDAQLDGTIEVGGYCADLVCGAELRGSLSIGGDLLNGWLQRGVSGTLTVNGYLLNLLEVGCEDRPAGLAGAVRVVQSVFADVMIFGNVTGRVDVGSNWCGPLHATGRLLHKPDDPIPHAGAIAVGGSFVGTAERKARIQFDEGMGGEGSAGGEFFTCDFDGWDEGQDWGPYADVVLAGHTYTHNEPALGLFEVDGCPGDLLNDGDVDFDDLNPFIDALSDPALYRDTYPGLAGSMTFHADCNCDGILDFDDIPAFVARLGQPCPDPEGCVPPEDGPRLSAAELASGFRSYLPAEKLPLLRDLIGEVVSRQSHPQKHAYWAQVAQNLAQ